MVATHLLLDRPCQYDRKVIHDGVQTSSHLYIWDKRKKKKEREVEMREIKKRKNKSEKSKSEEKVEIKEPTQNGKSNREKKSKESLLVGPREVRMSSWPRGNLYMLYPLICYFMLLLLL
ncbi:hypothetical protein CR513_32780, partial [Mucuna pruriens]